MPSIDDTNCGSNNPGRPDISSVKCFCSQLETGTYAAISNVIVVENPKVAVSLVTVIRKKSEVIDNTALT